jgi:hypothetical protein
VPARRSDASLRMGRHTMELAAMVGSETGCSGLSTHCWVSKCQISSGIECWNILAGLRSRIRSATDLV